MPAATVAARTVVPRKEEAPPPPIELEPVPPAHEEDENEEVGRPEGPLEELHVDPYAWGPAEEEIERISPAAAEPAAPSAPTVSEPGQGGGEEAAEVEPLSEEFEGGSPAEPMEEESEASESKPDEGWVPPPRPAETPPSGPTYGRRPGRSRKGPGGR